MDVDRFRIEKALSDRRMWCVMDGNRVVCVTFSRKIAETHLAKLALQEAETV